MKYSTLIPLALACFQSVNAIVGRAHCTDKCAMAIASDGNKAVHKSLMSDCDAFLGTTYYPTTRCVQQSPRRVSQWNKVLMVLFHAAFSTLPL